jgi:hypothetical protein
MTGSGRGRVVEVEVVEMGMVLVSVVETVRWLWEDAGDWYCG